MSVFYGVEKTCLRYVVPFQYAGTFLDALHQVEPSVWVRKVSSDRGPESDLYRYIRNEFLFEDDTTAPDASKCGCTWVHKDGRTVRKKRGRILELFYYPNGASIAKDELSPGMPVTVSDAGLLLFRNGLGFFWYELEVGLRDSAALVQFQNKIRELNRHGKSILWEVPEKKDQNIEQPFSFGYWIHELLAELDIGVRYFAERKSAWHSMQKNSGCLQPDAAKQVNRPAPDKAILFSYYVLRPTYGESRTDREALAYLLTNGYTDSYEYSGETSADMKHPFGNVIFYATQEGAAYLAWAKEPQVFDTTIYSKFQNDYFTLFIKVLYQSFSLLIYAEKIQREILAERDVRGGTPVIGSMSGLLEEINLFLAKSMATSVSHIHHQSEFYVYLKQQLRVHEDVKSVTAGLNALDTLQKEENEKHERESDNQISAIMGLFALLGISSALVDGFDFITRFFDGESWSQLGVAARCVESVAMMVILIVSAISIYFAIKAIRNAFDGNIHRAFFNWVRGIKRG